MYKALQLFAVSAMTVLMLFTCPREIQETFYVNYNGMETDVVETTKSPPAVRKELITTKSKYSVIKQEKISELILEPRFSNEDIIAIADLAMAEAEGECEEGQRLVIDSVINRMNSKHFPNTASGVMNQKYQYSCMLDGRIDRCEPTDNMIQLVREEIKNTTNSDIIFFTAGQYSKYGKHLFTVGNHYFSSL